MSIRLNSAIGFFPRIMCPAVECRYCLAGHQSVCDLLRTTHFDPGGFAEYIRVPKINVELGTLADSRYDDVRRRVVYRAFGLCRARAAIRRRSSTGQTVLVIGSGISGLLHIQLPRARGAARIIATDISDFRLKAATTVRRGCGDSRRGRRAGAIKGFKRGRLADLSDRLHGRHAGDSAGGRNPSTAAVRCYSSRPRRPGSMCRSRSSILAR